MQVAGAELAGFRSAAQQLEAAAHAAEGEAKEAKMLEAQARAQHEADKARIADLNKYGWNAASGLMSLLGGSAHWGAGGSRVVPLGESCWGAPWVHHNQVSSNCEGR